MPNHVFNTTRTLLGGLLVTISATAQQYTVVDLGTLNLTNSIPGGINSAGTVVGNAYEGQKSHAFIYSQGQQRDLYEAVDDQTKALGGGLASAWAINGSGEILAQLAGGHVAVGRAVPAQLIYKDGKVIGPIVGGNREARLRALNNAGVVVGDCLNVDGAGSRHACRYKDFSFADLPSFDGHSGPSTAAGINDSGQIAGSGLNGKQVHAATWTNDVIRDLGTLPGGSESWATCINASGQVAGVAKTAANEPHAFLYSDSAMKDLGALGGSASEPTDINAAGQIVGKWLTGTGQVRPFLYQNGVMRDLNNIVTGPLAESVTLHVAVAINDSGFIAARGVDRRTHATRAYLLVPSPAVPGPATSEPPKP